MEPITTTFRVQRKSGFFLTSGTFCVRPEPSSASSHPQTSARMSGLRSPPRTSRKTPQHAAVMLCASSLPTTKTGGLWKTPGEAAASPPANNNGNGSTGSSGFNQLRNESLTAARRVATTKKQAIGEVVEWGSGGTFKYGDIGRMTEGDASKVTWGSVPLALASGFAQKAAEVFRPFLFVRFRASL